VTRARVAFRALALALAITLAPAAVHAQLAASNLAIAQVGDVVGAASRDRTDVYDKLDLAYRQEGFAAGVRFEHDRTSFPGVLGAGAYDQGYDRLTQRWAEWSDPHASVRVGNFYTILGRGLIHRSFELPGVVYDEAGSRARYAAARDVDGVLAQGNAGVFQASAFSGRPSDATIAPLRDPVDSGRYRGTLSGAQLEAHLPRGVRAGAAWSRFVDTYSDHQYGSGFASADLLSFTHAGDFALPVAFEYALAREGAAQWWQFRRGHEVPHALYSSAQLLWREWSLSAEYKDYDQFRLGINDPPSLVREHSAPLLNRDTHLLDADGEAGFQLEGTAPVHPWVTLVGNFSRADGPPGVRYLRFEERYGELRVAPPHSDAWDATFFADRGFDRFDFIGDRHSAGVSAQARLPRGLAVHADLERKRSVTAPFRGPARRIDDRLIQLDVSRAGWGSVGVTAMRTTDPGELPLDRDYEPTSDHRWFVGFDASAQLSRMHTLSLFVGKRRGGRACTSGTCYDVPSLDGAELRWTTRL
jgi:hypothetical protein